MKNSLIKLIFLSLLIASFSVCCSVFSQEKIEGNISNNAEIELLPNEVIARQPYEKYFITEVEVFNNGSIPLEINNIVGSCYCANGKVLNPKINPLDTGKIYLSVNIKGMDGGDMVEFMIYSNALNSPKSLKIRFPDLLDSSSFQIDIKK